MSPRIIKVRPSRNPRWQKQGGWEVFEAEGVCPVYCGETGRQNALEYAHAFVCDLLIASFAVAEAEELSRRLAIIYTLTPSNLSANALPACPIDSLFSLSRLPNIAARWPSSSSPSPTICIILATTCCAAAGFGCGSSKASTAVMSVTNRLRSEASK